MSLDFTKLQAAVAAVAAVITKLQTDVPAAITAAAGGASDAANQAAIDSTTASLQTAADALGSLDTSVLPKAS